MPFPLNEDELSNLTAEQLSAYTKAVEGILGDAAPAVEPTELTEDQLRICRQLNCDPAHFLSLQRNGRITLGESHE